MLQLFPIPENTNIQKFLNKSRLSLPLSFKLKANARKHVSHFCVKFSRVFLQEQPPHAAIAKGIDNQKGTQ